MARNLRISSHTKSLIKILGLRNKYLVHTCEKKNLLRMKGAIKSFNLRILLEWLHPFQFLQKWLSRKTTNKMRKSGILRSAFYFYCSGFQMNFLFIAFLRGDSFSSPWNLIWANVKKGPVVSKIEFGRNQFPFQKIIEPLTLYGQLDPLHFFIIIIHVFFVLNI